MEKPLNTLIYKRTHTGDPNTSGTFGCEDCMGQVRGYHFDAVIGVGGTKPFRKDKDIALEINWIGIRPSKASRSSLRGPLVTFKYFVLWEETGPALEKHAPKLFSYMFEEKHVRLVMSQSLPIVMQKEVRRILTLAKTLHPRKPSRVFEKTPLTKFKC